METIHGFAAPLLYCLLLGSAWGVIFKKEFAESLAPAFMLHIIMVMCSGILLHKLSVGIWGGVLLFAGALAWKAAKAPYDVLAFLKSALPGGVFIFAVFYVFCFLINKGKVFIYWDDYGWGMFVKESLRLDALFVESQLPFWHKDYVPAATLFEVVWCHLTGRFLQADIFRALQIFGFSMMLPMIARVGRTDSQQAMWKCGLHQLGAAFLVMGVLLLLFQSHWHLYHAISLNFYSTISLDSVLGMTFFYCFMQAYRDWKGEESYQALVLVLGFSILVLLKQIGIALLPMVFVFYVAKRKFFPCQVPARARRLQIFATFLLPSLLWGCFVLFANGFADRVYVTPTIAKQSYATVDFYSIFQIFTEDGVEVRNYLSAYGKAFVDALLKREIIFPFGAPYAAIIACSVGAIFAMAFFSGAPLEEGRRKISFAGGFVFAFGIFYAFLIYLAHVLAFDPVDTIRIDPYGYYRYMGTMALVVLLTMFFLYYNSRACIRGAAPYCVLLVFAALYLFFGSIRVAPMMLANRDASVAHIKNIGAEISGAIPENDGICVHTDKEWFGIFQRLRFYISPRAAESAAERPEDMDMEILTQERLRACLLKRDWFFYMGDTLNLEFFKKYAGMLENPGGVKSATLYKVRRGENGSIHLAEERRFNLGKEDGMSALMLAAWQGSAEIAEMLIAKGTDTEEADGAGDTALMLAVWRGHTEVVKKLLEGGADVNVKNRRGITPLMVAAELGHEDIARLLLDRGAEVDAAEGEGWTALKLAERGKHAQVVEVLKAAGAKE